MRRVAQYTLIPLAIAACLSLPARAQTQSFTWSGPSLVFKPLAGSTCQLYVQSPHMESGTLRMTMRNNGNSRVAVRWVVYLQEGSRIYFQDFGPLPLKPGPTLFQRQFPYSGGSLVGSILTVEIKSCQQH